jgi:molybdate-binding protein/DNA-binding XRE family transcriptional regulator
MRTLVSDVTRRRGGRTQEALAREVGISRQALSALENGHTVPSTDVALRLAAALGCRVEDLFALREGAVAATRAGTLRSGRAALAYVNERWVAHATDDADMAAADALVERDGTVRLLGDAAAARQSLACAGCAPALGLLASRTARRLRGSRVLWLERSSGAALDLLAKGEVHLAGAHLLDERTQDFNLAQVRAHCPDARVVTLARWEAGLVVPKGNPLRLKSAADLVRHRVRVVRRDVGSGAEALLKRALGGKGPLWRGPRAKGHLDVARAVAVGAAGAGVAIRSAALAFGLDFVPLAEERFDLIFPTALRDDARVKALLETLTGEPFLSELRRLGGHSMRDTGRVLQ